MNTREIRELLSVRVEPSDMCVGCMYLYRVRLSDIERDPARANERRCHREACKYKGVLVLHPSEWDRRARAILESIVAPPSGIDGASPAPWCLRDEPNGGRFILDANGHAVVETSSNFMSKADAQFIVHLRNTYADEHDELGERFDKIIALIQTANEIVFTSTYVERLRALLLHGRDHDVLNEFERAEGTALPPPTALTYVIRLAPDEDAYWDDRVGKWGAYEEATVFRNHHGEPRVAKLRAAGHTDAELVHTDDLPAERVRVLEGQVRRAEQERENVSRGLAQAIIDAGHGKRVSGDPRVQVTPVRMVDGGPTRKALLSALWAATRRAPESGDGTRECDALINALEDHFRPRAGAIQTFFRQMAENALAERDVAIKIAEDLVARAKPVGGVLTGAVIDAECRIAKLKGG